MQVKNKIAALAVGALLTTSLVFATTATDNVMYKQTDGTYVINTTSLTPKVKGFKGATPVKVYIKGNKVVKVEALKNQETPKYFNLVAQKMLPKYTGTKITKTANIDGATGATYSSKAIKANVEAAIKYYKANK
ncbi:FMN-binding protein [Prevotella ihumii]|uniref:FMN-binding protein n=1 Tax=Prevotella ihumii TaxID=1917878 RepID=UPI000981E3E2|nr:FMN-binding protein [Prevotella ihumii]